MNSSAHASCLMVALGLCAGASVANVVYVDDDAPTSGDGETWATAYRFLQDALTEAGRAGSVVSEIRVAAGAYLPDRSAATPAGSGDPLAAFQLVDGVTVAGGYAGLGAPDPDARDIARHVTILSGDLLGDDGPDFANRGDNSWHVVTGSGNDSTAILDGVTITAGNAAGPSGAPGYVDYGGGMLSVAGSPTVRRCRFEGNFALGCGGGMASIEGGSPEVAGCTFVGNVTEGSGAGLIAVSSNATIAGSAFTANVAMKDGGGAWFVHGGPTIDDCVLTDNVAQRNGGGIWMQNSSPKIVDCTLTGNLAQRWGGGVLSEWSGPVISGCTFAGNVAQVGGGMHNGQESNAVVADCSFVANHASDVVLGGGGIASTAAELVVRGSLFLGNVVDGEGAAMMTMSGITTIRNCTLVENQAAGPRRRPVHRERWNDGRREQHPLLEHGCQPSADLQPRRRCRHARVVEQRRGRTGQRRHPGRRRQHRRGSALRRSRRQRPPPRRRLSVHRPWRQHRGAAGWRCRPRRQPAGHQLHRRYGARTSSRTPARALATSTVTASWASPT